LLRRILEHSKLKAKIKVFSHGEGLPLPAIVSAGSAGYDIYAAIDEDVNISAWNRLIVPTGISISLPTGYEAQIRPRSGLAFKNGITIINTPGTIDSDFTGEIKVCLINLSDSDYKITRGMRIAQMVVSKYESIEWIQTDKLELTDRGEGGFGHTGT
jgi:dUTP pyrophosphatase